MSYIEIFVKYFLPIINIIITLYNVLFTRKNIIKNYNEQYYNKNFDMFKLLKKTGTLNNDIDRLENYKLIKDYIISNYYPHKTNNGINNLIQNLQEKKISDPTNKEACRVYDRDMKNYCYKILQILEEEINL